MKTLRAALDAAILWGCVGSYVAGLVACCHMESALDWMEAWIVGR